jgi:pimeloyl-ACP methyl ester carboxylesterase
VHLALIEELRMDAVAGLATSRGHRTPGRRMALSLAFLLGLSALAALLGVRREIPAATAEARYASPASRFIAVDGMRVHYRDRGAGPALVLLHGSNSSLHTWEGWVSALSPGHRVVTLDLPGHGLTGPHPEGRYTAAGMAEFVDHFVAALKLDRFSIGGNSMGGDVAWHYALEHPERVERLVLVDPYVFPQAPAGVLRLFALPFIGRLSSWITPRFLVARALRDVYGDPARVSDAVIDRHYALLLREGNRDASRRRFSEPRDDGLTARLHELRMPALILWGSLDRWISPLNGERLVREIPGARLVTLEGLGHVPMEEDPARSVAPVLVFLR